MTAKHLPETDREYLHGIWERVGRIEGTIKAQQEARDAACAKQVGACGARFDRLEQGNGLTLRLSGSGLKAMGKALLPYLLAALLAILGVKGWEAVMGAGQAAHPQAPTAPK